MGGCAEIHKCKEADHLGNIGEAHAYAAFDARKELDFAAQGLVNPHQVL